MAATLTIVNQHGQTLAAHRLGNTPLAIRAQDQVQYQLAGEGGLAPANVEAARAGNDLLVHIDGQQALRIEDYFLLDESGLKNPLLGMNGNGQYVAYGIVEAPNVLPVEHVLAEEVAGMAASEGASVSALTAFGIGTLALGGLALAAQSSNENNDQSNQPAPPPADNGNTTPPPSGGGNTTPPPAGGGGNTNPPPQQPKPNGSITIEGEAKVGQTLTAKITDADGISGSPKYQWLADGQPIQGATQSTYTLTANEKGKAISVQATYTDDAKVAENPSSAATAPVIEDTLVPPPPAADTTAPTLAISATPSTLMPGGSTQLTFKVSEPVKGFAADDVIVQGGTLSNFRQVDVKTFTATFTAGAAGKASVTVADDAFVDLANNPNELANLELVIGAAPTPQNHAPSDITLSAATLPENQAGAVVGKLTTVDEDKNDQHTYTVNDQRFEVDAQGNLKLKDGVKVEFAQEPQIRLTITTNDGKDGSYSERFTLNVQDDPNYPAPTPPAPNGTVRISGEAKVGGLLTAQVEDADGFLPENIEYQWYADGIPIANALEQTYRPTTDDQGKALTVRASYIDNADQDESPLSAETAPVADAGNNGKLGVYVPKPATDFIANVKDFGAKGDGQTDDSAAIQAAINEVAAQGGGIVDIPAGTYLVDGVKNGGINVRSNVIVRMADDTVVQAIPNAEKSYTVFRIHNADNAHILGGTIVGERDAHQGTEGQGGYGVWVLSSKNVVVENVTAKNFWGDGFLVSRYHYHESSPENVVFYNVVADNNRRQGLSITDGNNIKVIQSVFKNTEGHSPQSGIDIEPNPSKHSPMVDPRGNKIPGKVTNVEIIDSVFENNTGFGIIASANGDAVVENVRVINNRLDGNLNAITFKHVNGGEISGNTTLDDGRTIPYFDVDVYGGSQNIIVKDNTLYGGSVRTYEAGSLEGSGHQVSGNHTKAAVFIKGAWKTGATVFAQVEDGNGVPLPKYIQYQWQIDGQDIAGATQREYTIRPEDSGKRLSVRVAFPDGSQQSETAESKPTLPIDSLTDNAAPSDIRADSPLEIAEGKAGASAGRVRAVDGDRGDDHVYSVSDARFDIDAYGHLRLKRGESVNYNTEQSIDLTVTATDRAGNTFSKAFSVAVKDDPDINTPPANRAPTDIRLSADRLPENKAGAIVGKLTTTDPDKGDTHTYTVNDQRFEVTADGTLKLKDGVKVEFADEQTIALEITTSDGKASYSETLTLQVQDDPNHPAPTPPGGGKLGVHVPKPVTDFVANVKDAAYGAKGDGQTDDTAAIQKAINAVAAKGGGIVEIPAGDYLVDAVKSLHLKSNVIVRMADDAVLKAIPNDADSYAVFTLREVDNAHLLGGTLVGERDAHLGSKGEWGMGVLIRSSSNVVVENVTARDFWGDGFYTGKAYPDAKHNENIVFYHITADNNRRQGITLSDGNRTKILDSVLQNTKGTAPQAGIDLEPNDYMREVLRDVEIRGNTFTNNGAQGVQVGGSVQGYDSVFDVTIADNHFSGNPHSIYISGLKGGHITGNTIHHDNFAYRGAIPGQTKPRMGIFFSPDSVHSEGVTVEGNTIYGSGVRTWPRLLQDNTIGDNIYKAAVFIRGDAQVGNTLESYVYDHDGLPDDAQAIRYQWQADGKDIDGATGASYTVRREDAGKAISVRVAFTDDAGQSESAESPATATVPDAPPPANDGKLGVHVPKPATDFVANAKDYGAKGDGQADDTAAIQKAVDAVAEKGGGVVEIPGGTYLIDTLAQAGRHSLVAADRTGIMMKSNVILKLADDAVLKALPNASKGYSIVTFYDVDNAHLIGGTLIGERHQHQSLEGQSGHGVRILSAQNVVIENVTARDFWGDGFIVGINSGIDQRSQNIVFYNVTADNNRRQGLSIVDGQHIKVLDSVFKNTNGHMPLSGIDIEPNPGGVTTDIEIRGNRFENNSGFGIVVSGSQFNRDNAFGKAYRDTVTKNVVIEDNTFEGNRDGIAIEGLIGGRVAGNTIRHGNYVTTPTGGIRKLWLDDMSRDITVENNTIYGGGHPRGHRENGQLTEGGGIENKGQNNTIRNNSYKADVFVRGHMKAGETVSAHVYDGDIVPAEVRYQWLADGKPITGATSRTYRLTDADHGKRISVQVAFTDGAGQEETATSAASNPIGSPQPNHAPLWAYVVGKHIADETPGHVIGKVGVHDPDPGETYSYRINDERFEIVADTLKLKDGIQIDDADEKSVFLAIEITDSGGHSFVRELDLSVAQYGTDGKDRFTIDGNGVKTLVGFNVSHGDLLQLDSQAFTALEKGTLAPGAFVKGKAATATSAEHRILYDTESGTLAYDPDGNGSAAATTIARLDPAAELEAQHILII